MRAQSLIVKFIKEFEKKKFVQSEIEAWILLNYPEVERNDFYFYKKTTMLFCNGLGNRTYCIDLEKSKRFLKKQINEA